MRTNNDEPMTSDDFPMTIVDFIASLHAARPRCIACNASIARNDCNDCNEVTKDQ
jgi:hypothetical protein